MASTMGKRSNDNDSGLRKTTSRDRWSIPELVHRSSFLHEGEEASKPKQIRPFTVEEQVTHRFQAQICCCIQAIKRWKSMGKSCYPKLTLQ
ncbi:hypothetical protein K1719_031141 [Acacia pycnantha]|nr:hypothetical protein K1719_031141 [Acacia pycnantha]